MYVDNEDVYYYLTLYNEAYAQPPKPEGSDQGIIDGLYKWAPAPTGAKYRATILFSGPSHSAAREAQTILAEEYGVGAELWSATSYKKLREEAMSVDRWNCLHPGESTKVPFVTRQLEGTLGPVIAVTDYMRTVPDQISRWVPRSYTSLGTDGYGRSDTREALREFFETDANHVVVATLSALARDQRIDPGVVREAIERFGIDPDIGDPWTR